MKTKVKQIAAILKEKQTSWLPDFNVIETRNQSLLFYSQDIVFIWSDYFNESFTNNLFLRTKDFVNAIVMMPGTLQLITNLDRLLFNHQKYQIAIDIIDSDVSARFTTKGKKENYLGEIHGEDIHLYDKFSKYISNDELRPVMNAVCHDHDNLVASDTHMLIWHEGISKLSGSMLLPKKVIRLLKLFPQNYKVYETGSFYRLINKRIPIEIKYYKVNGNYPTWKTIVPKNYNFIYYFDRDEALGAVKKLKAFTNTVSMKLELNFMNMGINLTAGDIDFNRSASIEIYSEYETNKDSKEDFREQTYGISVHFFEQILDTIKNDLVVLKVINNRQAYVFNDFILCMPMMVNA